MDNETVDEAIFETPEPVPVVSNIRRSAQIGELVAALAKAQGEFGQATKDSDNPYYSSKYADLAAVIGAVRPALSKNGVAVLQIPCADLQRRVGIVTMGFFHGEQFIEFDLEAPAVGKAKDGKDRFDVQTLGACWTYLRRYGLQGATCLASEDNDGNELAEGNSKAIPRRQNPPQSAPPQATGTRTTSPERPVTTQQSPQQAEQRAATAPAAAKPQSGQLKFIPPNGLTCVIRKAYELSAEKLAEIAKEKKRPWLTVEFLGSHNGVSEASCFDTKYWDLLKESVGLECHFLIKERDAGDRRYINIDDVRFVDGVEYQDGKPLEEIPQ